MYDSEQEPRLFIPALKGFYDQVAPWSWPLVRFAVGWNLAVHGWGKVLHGPAGMAKAFTDMGFHDPTNLILLLTVVEFVGGVCIILGLFTRFFAAAAAIEMGYITFVLYFPTGFSWLARGYEYTLMWGIVLLAIALRGGGPYSLDRRIGRQL